MKALRNALLALTTLAAACGGLTGSNPGGPGRTASSQTCDPTTLNLNGGTIGIAAVFNPTATFTSGNYIITGNTIDFNGSVSAFGGQLIVAGLQSVRLSSVSFSGAATYNLLGAGTLSTSGGTTTLVTTLTIGALNGVATSALKGYNGGGAATGGAITYQIGDANVAANFAGMLCGGVR